MSYFSEIEYKQKEKENIWFEKLYFDRWFGDVKGLILDVGCATGNFIACAPEIIEGIDIDEDSLKVAQSRGFKVKLLDIEEGLSGIESERYEGLYAKHVIEHLNNPLNFLKEIRRVLKPDGKAVISTPNCPYMLDKNFWDDYTHRRPFTQKSLAMIAYDAGFRDFKIYEDFRCFPGLGKVMKIFHLSPKSVRRAQNLFGIRGLSLILELKK